MAISDIFLGNDLVDVSRILSLIDKIDDWENLNNNQKEKIIKDYVDDVRDYNIYLDYIEKYRSFLAKNSFKNLSKDIINL